MRIHKIRKEDIANGPGIRVSMWVQGCNRHCKNCFNPETWDFNQGHLFNRRVKEQFLALAEPKKIVGFSILGGEPLEQGKDMLALLYSIRQRYGDEKTIWLWTGYKYEDLSDEQLQMISYVDVLVDGEFIDEQKCPNKKFKGSSNQRIIDIKKSLEKGEIQLYTI